MRQTKCPAKGATHSFDRESHWSWPLSLILLCGDPAMASEHAVQSRGLENRSAVSEKTIGCPTGTPAVPLVPLSNEPPARLVADPPVASHLAVGRVVIRYCVQNIRILPIFGEPALLVSPRLGHLHVTVDDGPWRWLDTSGEPIVVNLLPPGEHKILLELVDTSHRTLDRQLIRFVIPARSE